MLYENETARHAFAVLASAAILRAELRKRSAMRRALVIQSRDIIAELHHVKAMKGQNIKASTHSNDSLHRIWLSTNSG